jgi:hypothetical protein
LVCLYRAERDSEAAVALSAFDEAVPEDEARERGYHVLADSLRYHRPKIGLQMADRGLTIRECPTWTQDLLIVKALTHELLGEHENTTAALEELTSQEPSSIVGEGLVMFARVTWKHEGDGTRAAELFERVLAHPDKMRFLFPQVARDYAKMELSRGNPVAAMDVCERVLGEVTHDKMRDRGEVELVLAESLSKAGQFEAARDVLGYLAANHPIPQIRLRAGRALQEVPR